MQNIKGAGGVYFGISSSRLEGTEEKFRNRESRPEDLQLIAELKDMVSERESLVKKLVVGNRWLSNMWVSEDTRLQLPPFVFESEKINCLTVPGV